MNTPPTPTGLESSVYSEKLNLGELDTWFPCISPPSAEATRVDVPLSETSEAIELSSNTLITTLPEDVLQRTLYRKQIVDATGHVLSGKGTDAWQALTQEDRARLKKFWEDRGTVHGDSALSHISAARILELICLHLKYRAQHIKVFIGGWTLLRQLGYSYCQRHFTVELFDIWKQKDFNACLNGYPEDRIEIYVPYQKGNTLRSLCQSPDLIYFRKTQLKEIKGSKIQDEKTQSHQLELQLNYTTSCKRHPLKLVLIETFLEEQLPNTQEADFPVQLNWCYGHSLPPQATRAGHRACDVYVSLMVHWLSSYQPQNMNHWLSLCRLQVRGMRMPWSLLFSRQVLEWLLAWQGNPYAEKFPKQCSIKFSSYIPIQKNYISQNVGDRRPTFVLIEPYIRQLRDSGQQLEAVVVAMQICIHLCTVSETETIADLWKSQIQPLFAEEVGKWGSHPFAKMFLCLTEGGCNFEELTAHLLILAAIWSGGKRQRGRFAVAAAHAEKPWTFRWYLVEKPELGLTINWGERDWIGALTRYWEKAKPHPLFLDLLVELVGLDLPPTSYVKKNEALWEEWQLPGWDHCLRALWQHETLQSQYLTACLAVKLLGYGTEAILPLAEQALWHLLFVSNERQKILEWSARAYRQLEEDASVKDRDVPAEITEDMQDTIFEKAAVGHREKGFLGVIDAICQSPYIHDGFWEEYLNNRSHYREYTAPVILQASHRLIGEGKIWMALGSVQRWLDTQSGNVIPTDSLVDLIDRGMLHCRNCSNANTVWLVSQAIKLLISALKNSKCPLTLKEARCIAQYAAHLPNNDSMRTVLQLWADSTLLIAEPIYESHVPQYLQHFHRHIQIIDTLRQLKDGLINHSDRNQQLFFYLVRPVLQMTVEPACHQLSAKAPDRALELCKQYIDVTEAISEQRELLSDSYKWLHTLLKSYSNLDIGILVQAIEGAVAHRLSASLVEPLISLAITSKTTPHPALSECLKNSLAYLKLQNRTTYLKLMCCAHENQLIDQKTAEKNCTLLFDRALNSQHWHEACEILLQLPVISVHLGEQLAERLLQTYPSKKGLSESCRNQNQSIPPKCWISLMQVANHYMLWSTERTIFLSAVGAKHSDAQVREAFFSSHIVSSTRFAYASPYCLQFLHMPNTVSQFQHQLEKLMNDETWRNDLREANMPSTEKAKVLLAFLRRIWSSLKTDRHQNDLLLPILRCRLHWNSCLQSLQQELTKYDRNLLDSITASWHTSAHAHIELLHAYTILLMQQTKKDKNWEACIRLLWQRAAQLEGLSPAILLHLLQFFIDGFFPATMDVDIKPALIRLFNAKESGHSHLSHALHFCQTYMTESITLEKDNLLLKKKESVLINWLIDCIAQADEEQAQEIYVWLIQIDSSEGIVPWVHLGLLHGCILSFKNTKLKNADLYLKLQHNILSCLQALRTLPNQRAHKHRELYFEFFWRQIALLKRVSPTILVQLLELFVEEALPTTMHTDIKKTLIKLFNAKENEHSHASHALNFCQQQAMKVTKVKKNNTLSNLLSDFIAQADEKRIQEIYAWLSQIGNSQGIAPRAYLWLFQRYQILLNNPTVKRADSVNKLYQIILDCIRILLTPQIKKSSSWESYLRFFWQQVAKLDQISSAVFINLLRLIAEGCFPAAMSADITQILIRFFNTKENGCSIISHALDFCQHHILRAITVENKNISLEKKDSILLNALIEFIADADGEQSEAIYTWLSQADNLQGIAPHIYLELFNRYIQTLKNTNLKKEDLYDKICTIFERLLAFVSRYRQACLPEREEMRQYFYILAMITSQHFLKVKQFFPDEEVDEEFINQAINQAPMLREHAFHSRLEYEVASLYYFLIQNREAVLNSAI